MVFDVATDLLQHGEILAELPHAEAVEYRELIWWNGPILATHLCSDGQTWLYLWYDEDDEALLHRWLVTRTTVEAVESYVRNEISLLQLVQGTDDVAFCIDTDRNAVPTRILKVPKSAIPAETLPTADVFYDRACGG